MNELRDERDRLQGLIAVMFKPLPWGALKGALMEDSDVKAALAAERARRPHAKDCKLHPVAGGFAGCTCWKRGDSGGDAVTRLEAMKKRAEGVLASPETPSVTWDLLARDVLALVEGINLARDLLLTMPGDFQRENPFDGDAGVLFDYLATLEEPDDAK